MKKSTLLKILYLSLFLIVACSSVDISKLSQEQLLSYAYKENSVELLTLFFDKWQNEIPKAENQTILNQLNKADIDAILDYICLVGEEREIYYLWRPYLKDPKDDMFLELAVESESDFIITFNKKDYKGIDKFNLRAITPKEFLRIIGEKV